MRTTTCILAFMVFGNTFALPSRRSDPLQTAFVIAGDSTSYRAGGWGPGFCNNLVEGTPCVITAFSGASTGSFFADGRWNQTLASLRKNLQDGRRTFVTMQFGHNDQKSSPPETMAANLAKMVDQIRNVEREVHLQSDAKPTAEPILVTSLTRRNWLSNGTFDDILQPWADATIGVAENKNSACFDLHKVSMKYIVAIGKVSARNLNLAPNDNTHLNVNGEYVFGRMVADIFVERYGQEALPIIANPELSYNISHGIPSF